MDIRTDFDFKRRKYMPVFPKATGKPTANIAGYPSEDDQPMSTTGFHGVQITTLSDQFKRYFGVIIAFTSVLTVLSIIKRGIA